MPASNLLSTLYNRLQQRGTNPKAKECLALLESIIEATAPTRADRLDIVISLADPNGNLREPKRNWQALSNSSISFTNDDVEGVLEPFQDTLANLLKAPVLRYTTLKAVLKDIQRITRGLAAKPDLAVTTYIAISPETLQDTELSPEEWEQLIEAEAETEIDSLEIVEHIAPIEGTE